MVNFIYDKGFGTKKFGLKGKFTFFFFKNKGSHFSLSRKIVSCT